MKKREPNYKAFMPIGIVFIGTGVVFMTAVNLGVGIGMIGLGIVYLIIAIKKKQGLYE